jgi:hypothetical protein
MMKGGDQEDTELKQFVFWSVYFFEKSLSLRLGRASTIADWDIALPFPTTSELKQKPLLDYFSLWIRASRCQGRIYELLYSTDAIAQPDDVRRSRVATLAAEMITIGRDTRENDVGFQPLSYTPIPDANHLLSENMRKSLVSWLGGT